MRGLPAFGIRVLLCTALFSLGIFVDAYSIPFSFSDSADIVNKVCLYPCGEVGLEKGTKVTVDVTLSNANAGPEEVLKPIFFVVFTSNQYIDQHVDASSARTSDLCRAPSAKRFQLSGPRSTTPSAPSGSLSISFTISQLNQYYFVFLNCQSQYPVTYSGTLSFVNTNGQQLAYDQIPLIPLRVGLLSLYLIVLLWWIFHRFSVLPRIQPSGRNNAFLTNICFSILFVRTIYIGLELLKIQQLSVFGVYSTWSHIFSQIFDTISTALVHCVMLLISLGWRIARVINPRERQFLSGGFLLYAIFDFMKRFCSENLCTAYLLSFYVVKFLILFCILVAINSNIEKLRNSSFDAQAANVSTLYLKLSVFQNFRRLFIAFIILPGGINIIISMVLLWRNHLWANSLKEELEIGGLVACIAWIFRPSILRKIIELPPPLQEVELQRIDEQAAVVENDIEPPAAPAVALQQNLAQA